MSARNLPRPPGVRYRNALAPDYELLWYRVERVLGQGAFGITYLCSDLNLQRHVAVKEYIPGQLGMRDTDMAVNPISDEHALEFERGLTRFVGEAQTLARFEHPNIVSVLNVFEANSTAYMAMTYEKGESLKSILAKRGRLSESELLPILAPILDGLERVHERGFIHRDIKPGNIYVRDADGSPVLLDFGSARQTGGAQARTLTNFVSPGYAPIEQYTSKSDKQGPWTDVYGLGATLYKAVTGRLPVDAVDRSEGICQDDTDGYEATQEIVKGNYTPQFLRAIDHALAFRPQDRPQSIAEWRSEFAPLNPEAHTGFRDQLPEIVWPTLQEPTTTQEHPTLIAYEVPARNGKWYSLAATVAFVGLAMLIFQFTQSSRTATALSHAGLPPPVVTPSTTTNETASKTLGNLTAPTAPKVSPPRVADVADASRQPQILATTHRPTEQPAEQSPQTLTEALTTPTTQVGTQASELDDLLRLAGEDLQALRLTLPNGDNAYEKYQQVLAIDPNNVQAKQGIVAIAETYASLAARDIGRGREQPARHYLSKARELAPGLAHLPALEGQLVALATPDPDLAPVEERPPPPPRDLALEPRESPAPKKNLERFKAGFARVFGRLKEGPPEP